MIEGADGQLYLQAGAILIPGAFSCENCLLVSDAHTSRPHAGSWRLADKIGMHLDDIHLSGAVPQCAFFRCFSHPRTY